MVHICYIYKTKDQITLKINSQAKLLTAFIFILIARPEVQAQGRYIGFIGSDLVIGELFSNTMNKFTTLDPPVTSGISNIVYVHSEKKYFTVVSPGNKPRLASIDLNGKFKDVGRIRVNTGDSVFLVEGLAYDTMNCQLYISASLNGQDIYSESVVAVDPTDASGTVIGKLNTNVPLSPDMDEMFIRRDTMFVTDQYNSQVDFYAVPLSQLGATITPTLWYRSSMYTLASLFSIKDQMYFVASSNIYLVHPVNGVGLVQRTHPSSYSMDPMRYATYFYIPDSIDPGLEDTLVCFRDDITLSAIQRDDATYSWNTGASSSSIIVQPPDSGFYSVVLTKECVPNFDTAHVRYEVCDCDSLERLLRKDALDHGDTTLCSSDSIDISLKLEGVRNIRWNTGETTNTINISEPGSYWVTFDVMNCRMSSDTIKVLFRDCDSCTSLQNSIVGNHLIGGSKAICNTDSVTINISPFPSGSIWNDGSTLDTRVLRTDGKYWVIFDTNGCSFNSDTFELITVNCLGCKYYIPNAFSPNSDDINDIFRVFYDTSICDIEITMEIYNRWGEKLYEGGNHWDGIYQGKVCQNDGYMWIIRLTYQEQIERLTIDEVAGMVWLVR